MIEIYLKSNTNYDKNGDMTLEATKCVYKDRENEVILEHFIDEDGRWKYIDFENVIAAEENGKKKLFRIYNIVRSLNSVTAYARPIFYDLIDKVLIDVRPTNKRGEEALNIILADTPFTGHSNLTTSSTSYYIRKNIVEALLGDDENSFLNRWGGEFYCENFDVYINDRIGSDNGVRVEFGYNLNEIEQDINVEDVVTRIIPVGFNGIMLEGNEPWVDSPLILKYTKPKMRVITFSDIKVKENSEDKEGFETIEEARDELIKRCNKLFEEGIDRPAVNYKIDMIDLTNTTEYEKFQMLVNVNKGDTVTCYIPHLDIDVKARVIDYERDLLTGEYISLELGNAVDNIFNQQADIQATVNKITNSNGTVNAGEIQGVINAIQTQFKALKDVAQPQDVRAVLFEDRVEDSPTFGCMCLGTMGFEIASSFKPGTKQWDFRTFGTGQGFIADHIVAGILSTILIQNADGSLQIDLGSNKGIMTRKNGKNAIELAGTIMKFYDWEGGEAIGQLYSSRVNGQESVPGIALANKINSFLSLSYEKDNTYYSYIRFDKDNIDNITESPITFFEDTDFRNNQVWFGYNINSIYNSVANHLINKVKNNFIIADRDSSISRLDLGKNVLNLYDSSNNNSSSNRYCMISPAETFFGADGQKYFSCSKNGFTFWKGSDDIFYTTTADTIQSDRGFHINGNLTVNGNKNCVQNTENYGDRLYYSVEDCESYLTDRSMHLFTVEEVVNDGIVTYERVILLDSIFKESTRCDLDYTVEVIKQSWGDYRIKEQNKDYFIVEADRSDFTFKYIVTAKRAGFESVRNEELYTGCKYEDNTTDTEYWRLYINKSLS